MKKILPFIFTALLLVCVFPLAAQFRSEMRTADRAYELKAYNTAIESYKKALARRPNDVEALSRIADAYRMLNQIQTAHGYYQQAVRERKVTGQTILEHAHVLKALSRYDEAKQWYLLYARDHDEIVGNHYAQSCDFANSQQGQDAGFSVQSIRINSPVADFGPSLPTPNQLVFNSARTASGSFDGQAQNKPYVSALGTDGSLQQGYVLQNQYAAPSGNVGPVSYAPDGRQVLFTINNFVSGTRMIPEAGITMTLMIADVKQDGGWSNSRPLPFNGTEFSTGYGTFSQDGGAIYFCSDRPEGYGGYDIYRATRQGQSWESVPENLGTVVNSVGDEITPYFDGASLFFSSDWHHGMGEYDVFRAEMANDRPTTLYHMGNSINSDRDDIGFIYDPVSSTGYLVSNRIGGNGQEDIYRVARSAASPLLVVQSAQDASPLPGAIVDFRACGGQTYTTDAGGRYVLQSLNGLSCDVTISANGYQAIRIPVQSLRPDAENLVRVALAPIDGVATGGPVAGGNTGGSAVSGTTGGPVPATVPGGATPPGTYRGIVTDGQTSQPIQQANIQITQRTTGATANVLTNAEGTYIVALDPYNTYDVVVTAPDYETARFSITNQDGNDPNLLGNVTMLRKSGATYTERTTTWGGTTTQGGTTSTAISGYAVQLASLNKQPDLGRFGSVSNLGRVYDVNNGGSYKVRLGVFATRAEAAAAAARAKSAGYPGAFVVADNGVGASSSTTTARQPTYSEGATDFRVQLGAYGKPQNFNRNRAAQLGQLETTQRGALTIFRISSVNSLAQARQVQAQARSLGFTGAFILQRINGEFKKVP